MPTPPPSPESARMAALHEFALLDTPSEKEFDEITALAADICETPYAVISLMDEARLWFKSHHGLDATEIPRHGAFCAQAVTGTDLFLVPDALEDPRFRDNLLVQGELQIRFYAGAPLITPTGHAMGTLCVLDTVPRQLTARQQHTLQVLGHQVMTQMLLRRQVHTLQRTEVSLRAVITEQEETKASRYASEERFREMADKIGEVFYNYDVVNHRLLYANQAYERMSGISLEAVYEDPFAYLRAVHPEDLPAAEGALHLQLAGQETNVEFRVIRPDGSIRWLHEHGVPVLNAEGRVERIVGTVRDLTDHKLAEQKLREQATLLDKAQDAILVRDLEHRVLFWNQSAVRLYGWTTEEAVGSPIQTLIYKDPAAFHAATDVTLEEGEWTGELQQVSKDGEVITVEGRWSLVRDEQGRPQSILAINTDITERKKLEQQIFRTQRMESLGTLAGGIAHDLNNVLAPIMMSIELLKMSEEDPRRMRILNTIEGSAHHGADMVRQVLSFARGVESRQIEVNINDLLTEIKKIADETFLKNIQISTHTGADLWTIQGDPTQLRQVLLNLSVNARDAMPEGGTLTLSACNIVLDEHYAAMNMEAKAGTHVVLQVEDTGTGMPAGIVERIFEPFFTTKEHGRGTGLGLSTTQAIVKSHGGFIRVHSEVGKGSRFRVFLPATHREVLIPEEDEFEAPLPRGNGELILIVDDEASVRHITQQTLEAFGYGVLLASDGAEAIAIYTSLHSEIAAVVTDMMMPGMDGPSTIPVLLRINPKARIIAASGLNTHNNAAKNASSGVKHFLPKPYTADVLLKSLRLVLTDPVA